MYSCFENKLPKYDSEHETYVLFKEFFEYFPRNFLVNSYLGSLVLRFIIRIAKFTGHKETWKDSLSGELLDWWGTLAIDGISVLQTLQGKNDEGILPQERIIFIPKMEVELDVLCLDWEVLNEIQRSMKQLPKVNLQYVKGHQDTDTKLGRLSLLAQLNVEADALAGQYQDCYGEERPFVVMMAHTKAQLTMCKGTITRQYASTIRRESTYSSIFEHIRRKN